MANEIGYFISTTQHRYLDVKLYRDSSNVSTLFAGADPYTTAVLLKHLDIHYVVNTQGSRSEYTK